jgi:uncharacterized Fe-S cluster-containing radical SAM superfamily protein
MTKKNFCLYPFTAFSIDNAGKQRICCNNDAWNRVMLHKPFADPSFNLHESFNNSLHKEVRKYMIEDQRHPSCGKCWEIEDEGQVSWRQWFNDSFKNAHHEDYWISKCSPDGTINDIELTYLDITFGNKCNLKCVMCSGFNSTLFLKEQLETKEITPTYYKALAKLDWFEDNSQFEKLYKHVDKVERIHIVGGEPLIIEHQEFLQKFVELGVAKNIVISYNSNLTTLPREIINCWKEFKKIYLCVSVDGYKDINEFIRFPMKWEKLENNLREVNNLAITQGNISIQIHTTFSSLNCLVITEFLDWVNTISQELSCIEVHPMINYVFSPSYFDTVNLPLHLKEQAHQKFLNWEIANQEYINKFGSTERLDMLKSYFSKILREPSDPNLFDQCVAKIQHFESIRGCKYTGPNLLDKDIV